MIWEREVGAYVSFHLSNYCGSVMIYSFTESFGGQSYILFHTFFACYWIGDVGWVAGVVTFYSEASLCDCASEVLFSIKMLACSTIFLSTFSWCRFYERFRFWMGVMLVRCLWLMCIFVILVMFLKVLGCAWSALPRQCPFYYNVLWYIHTYIKMIPLCTLNHVFCFCHPTWAKNTKTTSIAVLVIFFLFLFLSPCNSLSWNNPFPKLYSNDKWSFPLIIKLFTSSLFSSEVFHEDIWANSKAACRPELLS